MISIPGLDHIIDAIVFGSQWLLKYGRSKKILIVGQGRSGKTSLFHYMRRRVIYECRENLEMTRVRDQERMFQFKESTDQGEIDVEVRIARDLSGQTYASDQAKWFISDKPHVLFVFIRFDKSLSQVERDIDNVTHWLDEFFSTIREYPRSLRQLVRITFVVSRKDQPPLEIREDESAIKKRMEDFREVVRHAYDTLPSRTRRSLSFSVYFLKICCNQDDRVEIKAAINQMLVESFVKL
jgi:hypothetical protein